MKYFFESLGSLAALALLSLFLPITPVMGQATPMNVPELGGDVPLFTSSVTNAQSITNTSSRVRISVPARSILILYATTYSENTGTSNTVLHFNASADGVNWTKNYPFTATFASTGTSTNTTYAVVGTNLPARFIALDKISTAQLTNVNFVRLSYFFCPYP